MYLIQRSHLISSRFSAGKNDVIRICISVLFLGKENITTLLRVEPIIY